MNINLKFTQDHIFKRIIVFQSALFVGMMMLIMVYAMTINMADDRFGMIVFSIFGIILACTTCLLLRDAFRKDRSKKYCLHWSPWIVVWIYWD